MTSDNEIKVWDPLVRVFHWSLVACFIVAFLSGDEWERLHVVTGYIITGLVAFRLLWGFIGTRHARFSDFVFSPAVVINYLKELFTLRAKRYLGHNPAGGWMVVALLMALALTTLTGMLAHGTLKLAGGFISTAIAHEDEDDDDEGGEGNELFEEVHEFFAWFTLALVVIHVAGVFISSLLHGENLVRAMITGRKPRDIE